MSRPDMEPEMMAPFIEFNAGCESIEEHYRQLESAEDDSYNNYKEQLELEIKQKREEQMETLNAEIHLYMQANQANMDRVLEELKEARLQIRDAEHAGRREEIEKEKNKALRDHLNKWTERGLRSHGNLVHSSPDRTSKSRQEEKTVRDEPEKQPASSREAAGSPVAAQSQVINESTELDPMVIDEADTSPDSIPEQGGNAGIARDKITRGKRKAEDVAEEAPLEKQKRTRRAEATTTSPRLSTELAGAGSSLRTRPQRSASQSQKRTERKTISFDEVYQDGRADHKHMIVEHPPGCDKWYILRCDEHGVHFGLDPLRGAAKHINVAEHGHLQKTYELAIDTLGHVVWDCNAQLAKKNNAVASEYFIKGGKPFNANHLPKGQRLAAGYGAAAVTIQQQSKSPAPTPRPRLDKTPEMTPAAATTTAATTPGKSPKVFTGITDPVVGELYLGYWSKTKTKYPILICPWHGEIEKDTGLEGTLASINMVTNAPRCIKVRRSTQEIIGWAAGYEDGGQHVEKREFPVVYLDKKKQVGWLAAKNISRFDFEDPEANRIPNFKEARDFYARLKGYKAGYEELKAHRNASSGTTGADRKNDTPDDKTSADAAPARRLVPPEAVDRGSQQPVDQLATRGVEQAASAEVADSTGSDDAEDNASDDMEDDDGSLPEPEDMETRETTFSPVATSATAQAPCATEAPTNKNSTEPVGKDERLSKPHQQSQHATASRVPPNAQRGLNATETEKKAEGLTKERSVPTPLSRSGATAPVTTTRPVDVAVARNTVMNKLDGSQALRVEAHSPQRVGKLTETPRANGTSPGPNRSITTNERPSSRPVEETASGHNSPAKARALSGNPVAPRANAAYSQTASRPSSTSKPLPLSGSLGPKPDTSNGQKVGQLPTDRTDPKLQTRPLSQAARPMLEAAQGRKTALSIRDILGTDVSPIRAPPGALAGSLLNQANTSKSLSPTIGRVTGQPSPLPPRPMSVQPANGAPPSRAPETARLFGQGIGRGASPATGYTNGRFTMEKQAAGRSAGSDTSTPTSRTSTPTPIRGDNTDQRWRVVRNPSHSQSPRTAPSPISTTTPGLGTTSQGSRVAAVNSPSSLNSPAASGSAQSFLLRSYSITVKGQGPAREIRREYGISGLPLTVDTASGTARDNANKPSVAVDPKRLTKMTLDTRPPITTDLSLARSVAVSVAEGADAVVQRFVFTTAQVGGRAEAGSVQARRFCQWVRAQKPQILFEHIK